MSKIYDLSQGNMGELARQQHRDQYATPLNGASVGSGGTRYYGEGQLRVENEGLVVTGSAEVIGQLIGSGTLTWSGPFNVTGETSLNGETTVGGNTTVNGEFTTNGALDVNGPTTLAGALDITGRTDISGDVVITGSMTTDGPVNINGATDISGDLDITGTSTLTGDLNVTGAGKIKAGDVTIDPSLYGGSVRFSNGTYVAATPNGAQFVNGSGGGGVTVSPGQADLGVSGGGVVIATAAGIYLNGLPTTSAPANLHIDPSSKQLFISTA